MLAFWIERARRLGRCRAPWPGMSEIGARAYDVRCNRRYGHAGDHTTAFGTRWTREHA